MLVHVIIKMITFKDGISFWQKIDLELNQMVNLKILSRTSNVYLEQSEFFMGLETRFGS